ncbi:PepSY domain-containing protein [Siphonobacter aquaeclarae]|uniref:PepSY-associated TM region n=1 Tax=Siphonobacter aquaeclarae TaxID=563176 RepID=A0A1G9HVL7_9BACT|nr:PepSY domain-containing protein [Siphonobacter aquaeclarae]SDL17020.1 PepSY-associated TM region [Siphonobacter aquaeclarae]
MEATMTAPATGWRAYIRKRIYRWHRVLGIITVIPVIFWCLSGIAHPFMSHWFKPQIAHEFVKPEPVNPEALKVPLAEILNRAGIPVLRTFRVISFDGRTVYQVMLSDHKLVYFDTKTGEQLEKGDIAYAGYLAQYFAGDRQSRVRVTPVTSFTSEYRSVNRLLPVWKVSFDRPDGMDVYVDTEQSRLANYNERSRKVFLAVFNTFHTWEWLTSISHNTVRVLVMMACLTVIILSMLSGVIVYGVLWKKAKKVRKDGSIRRYHRQIGIAVSLVTLTFAFSGAYHVSRKLTPDNRHAFVRQPLIRTNGLRVPMEKLPLDWPRVTGLSLAQVDGRSYYRVSYKKESNWDKKQVDQAETAKPVASADPAGVAYYDTQTASLLPDGMIAHAKDLVRSFWAAEESGKGPACCEAMDAGQQQAAGELPELEKTDILTRFDREYGFINKRLPVVKLSLRTDDHLSYYVEPATGHLAARITDGDRLEGLSFAFLHKYSGVDGFGKNFRDGITLFSSLGVLVVSVLGLILFWKGK